MGSKKKNIGNSLSNDNHEFDTSAHYKTSSRSFNSIESGDLDFNSNNDTNMTAPKSRSPHKSSRRKVAMVVKKPKSPEMEKVISSLEGELTSFLASKKVVPSKVDDGTSTTSRTTKSSHGSKDSPNGKKGERTKESSKSRKSNRDKSSNSNSKNRNKSEKDSSLKEVPWDWSHHSTEWTNIASTSQNGFEQNFDESFANFSDIADDEHVRTLNDSMAGDMMNSNHQTNSSHDCMSPLMSPGGRRARKPPHSSRRVQKQLEIQNSLDSSRRRIGEVPFGSSHGREIPLDGESRRDSSTKARRRSSFNGYNSDDTSGSNVSSNSLRRRTNGSSRRGPRTATTSSSREKSRDLSRDKCRDRSRDQSRDKPREKSRDKSLSRHKSREKSRDMSRDRSGSGHHRSHSQSRRGIRRSSEHAKPRSRSFDPAPTEFKESAPFSSASRRGRRRTSAPVEQPTHSRSERGRRRSSMGHMGASSTEYQGERENRQSKHRRGSSLSARTSRRRSMDKKSDRSLLSSSGNSGSSKDSTPNEPSRRRHRSRPRSGGKGLDVSARSYATEELLPERLSQMMDRGGGDQSHLEKLALAILVAEGENDLDQDIRDAVEKIPTHLLDPSKVRLNMQW